MKVQNKFLYFHYMQVITMERMIPLLGVHDWDLEVGIREFGFTHGRRKMVVLVQVK